MTKKIIAILIYVGSWSGLFLAAKLYAASLQSTNRYTEWEFWVGFFGLVLLAEPNEKLRRLIRSFKHK
jgi:hypothetical protein